MVTGILISSAKNLVFKYQHPNFHNQSIYSNSFAHSHLYQKHSSSSSNKSGCDIDNKNLINNIDFTSKNNEGLKKENYYKRSFYHSKKTEENDKPDLKRLTSRSISRISFRSDFINDN